MLLEFRATIPRRFPSDPLRFTVSLWGSPAGGAHEGGDWCDAHEISDTRTAVAIFDVAGHGEPVASTMHALRNIFFIAMRAGATPAAVLSLANTFACSRAEDTIVTAIAGVLDSRRREFTFANAGHPAPLLMSADAHVFLTHGVGDLPIGIFAHHDTTEHTVKMPDDALLVLCTDGLLEHTRDLANGERDIIAAARFAYAGRPYHDASAIAAHVLRSGRGSDDAAIIAVRAKPRAAFRPAPISRLRPRAAIPR
jgi:serine phosphatase RsbU (regulator of sigma subunit)